MQRKNIQHKVTKFMAIFVIFITIFSISVQPVAATNISDFYTENNIQTYDERAISCSASAEITGSISGDADPAAVKIFSEQVAPQLTRLISLYQRAAQNQNFAEWQLFAGIHYREHGMSTTNPDNTSGVFQTDYGKANDPSLYTPNKVLSDDEFVRQLEGAIINHLIPDLKRHNIDPSKPLTLEGAMYAAVHYNSGPYYDDPNLKLGIDPLKSTYAWAGFNTGQYKLPMTGVTGHMLNYVDARPGALTIWKLLKGASTANSGCANNQQSINNVVYYSQMDPEWGSLPFGDCGTIAACACGATSFAMVASTLTGRRITPIETTDLWARSGWIIGGTAWASMTGAPQTYGLKAETITAQGLSSHPTAAHLDQMAAALGQGKLAIVTGIGGSAVNGQQLFTSAGHFVVVRGVTANGNFLVNDPKDDKQRATTAPADSATETEWPRSVFLSEANAIWVFSK